MPASSWPCPPLAGLSGRRRPVTRGSSRLRRFPRDANSLGTWIVSALSRQGTTSSSTGGPGGGVGLFVTALLIPSASSNAGAHRYALSSARHRQGLGREVSSDFLVLAAITGSGNWFVWRYLSLRNGFQHQQPLETSLLSRPARYAVGVGCLIMLVSSYRLFPIAIQ